MKAVQRWPIVGAIGALVLGAGLLDRVPAAPEPELIPNEASVLRSVVDDPGPLSTSWYCAIGSSAADGYADHAVNVSNVSDQDATATVTVLTEAGPGPLLQLELGPFSTESIDLTSIDASDYAGAIVEIVGGAGVVGHDVSTEHGDASGPCATTVNGQWFFASGSTRRDSAQYIALMNPFGEDVVLDVTFRTATRERRPEGLSSYVVPGRTMRVVDVSDFVSIEPVVATTVTVVQGRVVAEQLQVANGDLGPEGAALALGTPAPALQWTLPAGRVSVDGDHQLVIQNPGTEQAELELSFDLSTEERRTAFGLSPIELTVQPGRFESLDVADLVKALQIPLPLEFGLRVVSANDVPVVVSRSQLYPLVDNSLVGAEDSGNTVEVAGGEGDATAETVEVDDAQTIDTSTIERRDPLGGSVVRQDDDDAEGQDDVSVDDVVEDVTTLILDDGAQPTALSGLGVSNGTSVFSNDWLVPYSRFLPDGGTVVVITAPEDALVEIRGMVDGQLLDAERVSIPGGTRRVVPLRLPVPRTALTITSNAAIAVELQTVNEVGTLTVAGAVPVLPR